MPEVGSLSADSIRDNAVEGEVNDYRLAGGYLGSVVFLFDPLPI